VLEPIAAHEGVEISALRKQATSTRNAKKAHTATSPYRLTVSFTPPCFSYHKEFPMKPHGFTTENENLFLWEVV
jgi:hypothetical protein